jgi:hypothetical protein
MSLYYIFKAVGLSLILTIIIEAGLALIIGLRKKDLLLVALVNIITNPAVVIIYLLLPTRQSPISLNWRQFLLKQPITAGSEPL